MPRLCPCGSGSAYDTCCGPLHHGAPAPTAERLMRSRYSAFVLGDEAHLLRTWHVTTRPADVDVDGIVWTGLEVLRTERGGEGDTLGVVAFRATFERDGKKGALHEVSRFTRDPATGWSYVRGRHPA